MMSIYFFPDRELMKNTRLGAGIKYLVQGWFSSVKTRKKTELRLKNTAQRLRPRLRFPLHVEGLL